MTFAIQVLRSLRASLEPSQDAVRRSGIAVLFGISALVSGANAPALANEGQTPVGGAAPVGSSRNIDQSTQAPSSAVPAGDATSSKPQPVSIDKCLWTFDHQMKVDMGSIQQLEAFVGKAAGHCILDQKAEGSATLTCRYTDPRTHRDHVLVLAGDDDGAECYGITHTELDGKTLPFARYARMFIDGR